MTATGVFQFGKHRTARTEVKPRPVERTAAEQTEPPVSEMFLQGRKATAPEWRVGMALNKRGLKYDFQKSILGGRVSGGQVLDFFIYTVPIPTPLNVNGNYWHRLSKSFDDNLKKARANEMFGNAAQMMVEVWESDMPSVDAAYAELDKKGIW